MKCKTTAATFKNVGAILKSFCFDWFSVPASPCSLSHHPSYLKFSVSYKGSGCLSMTQIIPNRNYSNMYFHFISQNILSKCGHLKGWLYRKIIQKSIQNALFRSIIYMLLLYFRTPV